MADVEISITRRGRLGVAPEAVFFHAAVRGPGIAPEIDGLDRYDENFHRLLYHWSFGDAASGAGSDKVVNLPKVHNDLNRAHGKAVAHVFTQAGRYEVTCAVHTLEGARLGESRIVVEIANPSDVFAETATILVDADGNGDPAAHPGAQLAPDLPAALEALENLDAPGRILLPRGTRHVLDAQFNVRGRYPHFHLGAWGRGDRPVVAPDENGTYPSALLYVASSFAGDAVIAQIAFEGLWDSTTETGRQVALFIGLQTDDKYHLLTDCTFRKAGTAAALSDISPDVPESRSAFTLHDCDITDWGDYGVYVGRYSAEQHVAIIGCAIHQHPLALMGGGNTKDGQRNQHGPVRLINGGRCYIACCDLFSRNGWTGTGSGGGVGADQPCLRWNTNSVPKRSAGVVDRVAMEGGFTMVAIDNVIGDAPVFSTNLVMDKCLLVGTARSRKTFNIEYGGVTIRNCLCIQPDRPLVSETWRATFYNARNERERSYADPDWPVEIYSNTVVILMSDANSQGAALAGFSEIDAFPVFRDENNLLLVPNAIGQSRETPGELRLAETPLATAGGVWSSRYFGVRHADRGAGAQLDMADRFATPADTVFTYAPQPGSAAIDSATGTTAADDFAGRLRDDPPDRGAWEV